MSNILDALDSPIVYLIVMTLLVLTTAHLLHMLANHMKWQGLAEYTSLPTG